MTPNECYKKVTLYPSILVILVTIVFSVIDNHDYKSEWMTADSVIYLSIVTAIIYCLIISALSTTILLNKFDTIKDNPVLNFLTWFLLPYGFITVFIFHEVNSKIQYDQEFGSDFAYVLILNFPFIVGLIWTYYKYRRSTVRRNRLTLP